MLKWCIVVGSCTVDWMPRLDGVGWTALRHNHPLNMLVWRGLMVLVVSVGAVVVGWVRLLLLIVVCLLVVGWLVVGGGWMWLVLGLVGSWLVWTGGVDDLPVRISCWLPAPHLMCEATPPTSLMVLIVLSCRRWGVCWSPTWDGAASVVVVGVVVRGSSSRLMVLW